MKTTYPTYKRTGDLLKIKNKLNPRNKKELENFGEYLLRTNKPSKINKVNRILLQFYDITGLNFYDKPTIEQRDKFFALLNNSRYKYSYKKEIRIYLRLWLKWKWKDLALLEDFPKFDYNYSDKVNEVDLLTEEEAKQILSTEPDPKWQTIISILYESGCRPEELLNLKWGAVKLDDEISDLTFITHKKSTIKSRVFPVKASTPYLKQWKALNKDAKYDDLVFPTSRRKQQLPISTQGLNFHLKQLAKKCKIERNIFPYLFRFTRASDFYGDKSKLDDRNAAVLLGHSPNMAKLYHKTSNKTAREMLISEIYKTKQLTKETKHKLEKRLEQLETILKNLLVKDVKEIYLPDKTIKNPQDMDIMELAGIIIKNQEKARKQPL